MPYVCVPARLGPHVPIRVFAFLISVAQVHENGQSPAVLANCTINAPTRESHAINIVALCCPKFL